MFKKAFLLLITVLMLSAIIVGQYSVVASAESGDLVVAKSSEENEVMASRKVPILMYHSVCKTNNNDYVLSPLIFENDIKYLSDNGFVGITVSELVEFVRGRIDLPKKPVIISFDDGFYNNLHYACPILQRYNFKAVLCLVGAYSKREEGEKTRSCCYSYLNYNDVNTLKDSGVFEFLSHSYDMHRNCGARRGVKKAYNESNADYERALTKDIRLNEQLYKDRCGLTFKAFAYPFGYYSATTPQILKKLGYDAILTCESGINKIMRGEEDKLLKLKRYNRPSGIKTMDFMERIVKINK